MDSPAEEEFKEGGVEDERIASGVTFDEANATTNFQSTYEEPKFDKFKVNIDMLINFIFDPTLQWPLAAGRLFAFALYGPLNENGQLCTGPRGRHVVSIWELDAMCVQIEKEDMLHIYLHRSSDMALLSSAEQEAIIGQADAHLKRAKGKAMLPRLTKQDVYGVLEDVPPRSDGSCSGVRGDGFVCFHRAQEVLLEYRAERVRQYKLVYPSLTKKAGGGKEGAHGHGQTGGSTMGGTGTMGETGTGGVAMGGGSFGGGMTMQLSLQQAQKTEAMEAAKRAKKKAARMGRVSESVAPKTMFVAMKGASNSDIIETTNRYLHKHAYKISSLDTANSPSMTANVRLLREIVPVNPNPYVDRRTGKDSRESWDSTSNLKGTRVGSLVQCAPSSTTAKRNTTAY